MSETIGGFFIIEKMFEMIKAKNFSNLDDIDEFDYSKIDQMAIDAAATLTDWHIDIRRPMSSVIFKMTKNLAGTAEVVPQVVSDCLIPIMKILIVKLRKHQQSVGTSSFTLDVKSMRFRAEKMRPDRYALRLVPSIVSQLDTLNLGPNACEILMDPEFRSGGLILIAGAPGSGKTTTAGATVVARLEKFGGYCLAIESPVECSFEGFHGNGYVEQIDASVTGFKSEVATAMRKFPAEIKSMFYFGEVIEEVAAAELTRLIGRGHLVITTIHSKDVIRAIEMLVALSERGGETYARQLIGGNLLAVVHQQLVNRKPVVTSIRINEAMKNIISNNEANLFLLSNEIDMAKRQKFARRASDRVENSQLK